MDQIIDYDDSNMYQEQQIPFNDHEPQDGDESLSHFIITLQSQMKAVPEEAERAAIKKRTEQRCGNFQLERFTVLEDKQILRLVQQQGPNFNKIVKYFPGKTMNMVKNRYYKKLRYMKEDLGSDEEVKKTRSRK